MRPDDIRKAVAMYAIEKVEDLEGKAADEGIYVKYTGNHDEIGRREKELVYGRPLDILADMMERGEFFGWYCSETDTGYNPNNGKVKPVELGDVVDSIKIRIVDTGGGEPVIDIRNIEHKPYLDALHDREMFLLSAQMISGSDDLEDVAARLYDESRV